MLMVTIIYTKSYTRVPKLFITYRRNLHVNLRYTFEAPCHEVFLKVVFQTVFQLLSFLSIVSVCKPVLGEGACSNQGKYDKIH